MIRKLQSNNNSDRADFESWATSIPQSAAFNWTKATLIESFEAQLCWGLWDQSTLQAVVCFLHPSSPREILWLATRPLSEGRGFMKCLLREALADASQRGSEQATEILLEVHELNKKALGLYFSLGFSQVGIRKNYYQDGAAALVFALKLE